MQISRFLAALGFMALASIPFPGRAADTDAQIKAREALRSKLGQLDSATNAPVVSVVPAAPSKPAPASPEPQPQPAPATPEPQSQPSAAPPQPVSTPPAPHSVQTPLPAETVPSRSFAAPAPVPAPNSQSAAPISEPVQPRSRAPRKSPPPVIAAPAADPDKIAQAREQMRQKLDAAVVQQPAQTGAVPQPQVGTTTPAVEPSNPPPSAPVKPVPTRAQPEPKVASSSEPAPKASKPSKPPKHQAQPEVVSNPAPTPSASPSSYKPLEGPPAPVTASQRQRLDELLTRYRADQVTPEQYHQERAKILAQP